MSASQRSIESGYFWLAAYFVLNLSLTLYNKAILLDFRYPWSLTAIHTLCGSIGCYILYILGVFTPAKLNDNENMVMLMFSVLYTINIAISNVSLSLVSVAFHQVIRAMTPVFTVIISIVFLQKSYSKMIYLSLLPVVLGVAFATIGEYDYTVIGFLLTVLGTVLAAVKTIVTNRVQVGRLKLHPLDLLLRMSPLAFVQCVFYAYVTGELERVREFSSTNMTYHLASGLLINGILAFALNIVSFTANKKTSALTMTVAGNVKQVLSIILAVIIFNLNINMTNAFGIALTLFGGAWYGNVEMSEKAKANATILPTSRSTTSDQPSSTEKISDRP
ncbi:triose-phosphate transporter family-domain-containing protein [Halteromyces radiatus]|uniref:triose-phosphate transporter family-domain-containing protein n=1 Tax=Halteromyces radiatus TaxID=101107 RepID=UPI00221F8A4F|nr:triose-phosphate transporter family-domain-containing protein [Halteromyces radiatus]KAI8086024.1 triose-phosphate transporter family-domain-containing protein [Halteromyces radiatus]